ncbi:MAG: hypothetical protein E7225_04650 [Clostridiales bacterium]|nr:hypothetical protein [Clostridiales bacterium]
MRLRKKDIIILFITTFISLIVLVAATFLIEENKEAAKDYVYKTAINKVWNNDFKNSSKMFDTLPESYKDVVSYVAFAEAKETFELDDKYKGEKLAEHVPEFQYVDDKELERINKKLELMRNYSEVRMISAEIRAKTATAPYDGMPLKYLLTMENATVTYNGTNYSVKSGEQIPHQIYTVRLNSSARINYKAIVTNGIVSQVFDMSDTDWKALDKAKENLIRDSKKEASEYDSLGASDFGYADDFYDEYWDDFYDYEDAESYWMDYQ